ncbi:CBS domain-containing protein [Thiomonas sp.]
MDDGIARDAVTVARVMVPRERIQVLDYSEVQHSLVLEQGPVPTLRGIFSTTQIGRLARRAERGVSAVAELRRGRASAGGKLSRPRGSPPSPPSHLWSCHGGGTMAVRGTG